MITCFPVVFFVHRCAVILILRRLGAVAGPARVGDDVADVFHPRAEEDETLEAQTETGVHHGAIPPQVHVPLVLGRVDTNLTHALLHDVDALLSLRPADELANLGVGGRRRYAMRGERSEWKEEEGEDEEGGKKRTTLALVIFFCEGKERNKDGERRKIRAQGGSYEARSV